jgi:hypothetical protein
MAFKFSFIVPSRFHWAIAATPRTVFLNRVLKPTVKMHAFLRLEPRLKVSVLPVFKKLPSACSQNYSKAFHRNYKPNKWRICLPHMHSASTYLVACIVPDSQTQVRKNAELSIDAMANWSFVVCIVCRCLHTLIMYKNERNNTLFVSRRIRKL